MSNSKGKFLFFNFQLVTRKEKKHKSLIFKLVTRSENFYFSVSS